MGRTDIVPGAQ